jgi:hypothetical protein
MQIHRFFCKMTVFAVVIFMGSFNLYGQNNGGGNGGGGGGNGGGGGGADGSLGAAGVEIDPQGVLRVMQNNPALTMQKLRAAKQALPQQLARPSKMRMVSLNRLEAQIAKRIQAKEQLTPEMLVLAGLTRVEYVFFYPESGDIVLAGPAEGFGRDANDRLVGVDTGKPCILLEDLVVALRAFPPQGDTSNMIKVSIDPTKEGLARMQETLKQIGSTYQPNQVPTIVNALRQSLGMNDVTLEGVPRTTHFAHVLTEADYRMKLIGIGLENPPVPMTTYIQKLGSSVVPNNALIRWFFVPDYNAVACSEDGHAMQMIGQGLKLIGEDEQVNRDGSRKVKGGSANPASKAYTTEFTKKFEAIAAASPVYGQLRNLVDLTIAAAFIQDHKFYEESGWNLGVLAHEDQFPVETRPAPRQVETAINAVIKGTRLITPIGGGVEIQARRALKSENLKTDETGEISKKHDGLNLKNLAADQWWWD